MIEKSENNSIERLFNENDLLWDEKYFSIIKIWYFIFIIICLVNEYIYYKDFHDNDALLIMVPFFHILIPGIVYVLKEYLNTPHGDKEYLLNYYPEAFKKMFFPLLSSGKYSTKVSGGNGFAIISFINGSYIKYGEDEIVDDIRERWATHYKILFGAMGICIVFVVITIIAIGLKHGLG
jgi:intracellular septation protein A